RTRAELAQVIRLAAARGLEPPQRQQYRHAEYAGQGIDRVEPGHRHVEAEQVEVDTAIDPDQIHVGVLVVADALEDGDRRHHAQRHHDAPLAPIQRRRGHRWRRAWTVCWQVTEAGDVG